MGPSKSGWASLLQGAFRLIANRGTAGAPNEPPTRPDTKATLGLLGSLFRKARGFPGALGQNIWQGVRAATQAMGARGYIDGQPYNPGSSWIKFLTFRPVLYRMEQYGADAPDELRGRGVPGFAVPDREYGKVRLKLFDSGDLIMTTEPNQQNSSGEYTYPNVPRSLMDAWTRAPSAGQFYWRNARGGARQNRNGIQTYSNRAAILLGRMKNYGTGNMGITSAISPKQSPPRRGR